MTSPLADRAIAILAAAAALGLTACSSSMAQDTAHPGALAGPVLVELFTSQGCSSCPPADKVLSDLGSDPKRTGEVIPLAFHVDYWDYIGWKDPFASATWSNRQRSYASAMHSTRIYTPQLVVNGTDHLVGSNRSGVDDAIAEARCKPALGTLAVTVEPVPEQPDKLRAVIAFAPAPDAPEGSWALMAALYENGVDTRVGRGENGGRKLHNDHIVRALTRACTVKDARKAQTCQALFDVDAAWKPDHLGVAAFAAHPETLQVRAAGVARPSAR